MRLFPIHLRRVKVNALAELANNVALGLLPLATAQAIAVAAFPLVPPATISKIFAPLKSFTPETPATPEQAKPAVAEVKAIANSLNSQGQVRAAISQQISPILGVLDRISQIKDDAQMLAALQNFVAQSDRFAALAAADASRVQAALEKITAPALVAGLQGKSPK